MGRELDQTHSVVVEPLKRAMRLVIGGVVLEVGPCPARPQAKSAGLHELQHSVSIEPGVHVVVEDPQRADSLPAKTRPDADFRGKVRLPLNHVVAKVGRILGTLNIHATLSAEADVGLVAEENARPLVCSPVLVRSGELQTRGDVGIGEWVFNPCHTTEETSFVEPTTNRACGGLDAQLGSNDARRGKRRFGGGSHDRRVGVLGCGSRATTSRHILKAVVILVVSDPVLDGALVAACQLSHSVVVQAHSVKSEKGGSLDETEAVAL